MNETQRIQNDDLVLHVSPNVDLRDFDINRYEAFLDALCGTREYQKTTIRTVLRYLLSGRYANLRELAEENFHSSDVLKELYRTFQAMEAKLQLSDRLACSVDLATATGKSYVMYGVATIMLAHGAVDRVLLLCPSRTIERGLSNKFRQLSGDAELQDLLPADSHIRAPHIIQANETITEGTICIENFHAVLLHVNSSIRDSLQGKGAHTLILNDEVHHVYNQSDRSMKAWKTFLLEPSFSFHYMVGFSGTCYLQDEYFVDVVSRYSLRQAIEDGYTKTIEYVAEDKIARGADESREQFQKIYDNHLYNRRVYRLVKPLTIFVTADINSCEELATDFTRFLALRENIDISEAANKVMVVTSDPKHQVNVRKLDSVDRHENPVEWIISVSMLTEGWDVANVFQIVPAKERAFNSKLLIAQVLGRGLRIPTSYRGERPIVTVFNHAGWSKNIQGLVDEVLEIEKRLISYPVTKPMDYNFTLHNINYSETKESTSFQQESEYEYKKGYVTLVSQLPELDRETTYNRIITGEQRQKKTRVSYRMYTVNDVIEHIHNRLKAIDAEKNTSYSEKYDINWLSELINASLQRIGDNTGQVSEPNRQRLLQAFGTLHREANKTVRYRLTPADLVTISTAHRPSTSIGLGGLRRGNSIFTDDFSLELSDLETQALLNEVIKDESLPRSAWHHVQNSYGFKTSLNLVTAASTPEREFIRQLVKSENATIIDAWTKSSDIGFYPIAFAWRKGEHPKRGNFNPDFFIKKGNHILVIEIKDDDEADDPNEENRAKNRAAQRHFEQVNLMQSDHIYHFHFLTPRSFDAFFQFLRNSNYAYVSDMDATLSSRM